MSAGHKRAHVMSRWLIAVIAAFLLPAIELFELGQGVYLMRFVLPPAALLLLAKHGELQRGLQALSPLTYGCIFYAIAIGSVTWSSFWQLTILKGIFGAVTFLATGVLAWALAHGARSDQVLSPFAMLGAAWFLLTALSIIAGSPRGANGLFQGPCDNPNMFASVTAVLSVPFAVAVRLQKVRGAKPAGTIIWIVAGAAILEAGSRAGLLLWACAVSFAAVGGFLGRATTRIGAALVFLLIAGYFSSMGVVTQPVERIMYKGDVELHERDILNSRRVPWTVAAEAAERAGALGDGFGVFPGYTSNVSWFTTVGYGFESGSTWLSMKQQLGVPGLLVFVGIGLVLLQSAARRFSDGSRGAGTDLRWVFTGVAIGLYVHGMFEAWFVSPGSAENALFWTAVGMMAGLQRIKIRSVRRIDRFRAPAEPAKAALA